MQKKVLVIDNTMSGWNRCQALADHGYTIDIAPTAEAGLQQVNTRQHDVIVIEERPNADSWQLCARVRQLSPRPLIVISPNATTEASVKAIQAGADYFLRRPVGSLELTARVNSLLRRESIGAYPPAPLAGMASRLS